MDGFHIMCEDQLRITMRVAARLLWMIATVLIASSCASPGIIERGDQFAAEGQFSAAYQTWKAAWITGTPEIQRQAIEHMRRNPRAIDASERGLSNMLSGALEREASGQESQAVEAMLSASEFSRLLAFHKLVDPNFDEREVINRLKREANAKEEERLAEKRRIDEYAQARKNAVWMCKGTDCDKVFALAQVFVDQYSDMKIQVATNTIVETFNPTEIAKVGLKVVKLPLKADEAEVRLTVTCKFVDSPTACIARETVIYRAFPRFMTEKFVR